MKFITDLDKTIIYSRETSHACIEEKDDGTPVTYMTQTAKDIMDEMMEHEDFLIIPCTLRSFEQAKRVQFTKNGTIPVMICDNGYSIYRHGLLDAEWDSMIRNIVDSDDVAFLYKRIKECSERNGISLYRLKSNRNGFISIIFHDAEDLKKYSEILTESVDGQRYRMERQGRKLYIIPKNLDKAAAVRHVISTMPCDDKVVTAGDSMVDFHFTMLGSHSLLPKHAVFSHQNSAMTEHDGIYAGEDIMKAVYKIYKGDVCT